MTTRKKFTKKELAAFRAGKKAANNGKRRPVDFRLGGFGDLETKFADTEFLATPLALTWTNLDPVNLTISGVAQGDGESERDGRVYHIRSVHMKYCFEVELFQSPGAPTGDTRARICVVLDKFTNKAQLTATDVMLATALTDDTLSYKNLQFTERFNVLHDKTTILRIQAFASDGVNRITPFRTSMTVFFNKTFPGRGLKVTCQGTTGNIAAIIDKSIHVIGVANSVLMQIEYVARVRFVG